MHKTAKDVLEFAKAQGVTTVDFRFMDLIGTWQHFSTPIRELTDDVKKFEPKLALVSGKEGTEIYKQLTETLPGILNPGAKVWFEIGFDQGLTVPALFDATCWKKKILSNDWAGHNRFFFLEFE